MLNTSKTAKKKKHIKGYSIGFISYIYIYTVRHAKQTRSLYLLDNAHKTAIMPHIKLKLFTSVLLKK